MKMTKNLNIALLVLVVILLGAYIFYYSFKSKSPPAGQNIVTQKQVDTAIADMKVRLNTNPPVSQSEKVKALQDLKNRMKQ